MFENVSINVWGALVAIVILTVTAALYFTVIIGRVYNSAVGRPDDAPPGSGPLFIVGPLVCNFSSVLASAVLISALEIDELGDALVFGAIVGAGYLVAMVFQIAINPVFARPLFYGLINAPYFLVASLVTSASLVLVG
jgi:Ni/Fe-hydrogenase subunit HybB-like protein